MRQKSFWAELLILFSIFFESTTAILTGQETYEDITQDPAFGCRWFGGSSATLSCICQPDNEKEFYIEENSIQSFDTEIINISDCKKVRIGSKSIHFIRNLRLIEFSHIESLQLDDYSLQWHGYTKSNEYNPQWDNNIPALQILIDNSNIRQISSYSFKGQIKSVIFKNVKIDSIAPFAFSSLEHTENIELLNVELVDIQPQAFKKFGTVNLKIEEMKADLLPSRSFSDVSVTNNFLISNCTFNVIKPGAFLIYNPLAFEVRNTKINLLSGEGFKITMKGNADFRNNFVNDTHTGAFRGLTLNEIEEVTTKVLTFDSNVFNTVSLDSFDITDFEVKFKNTVINEECDCKNFFGLISNSDYLNEIKCFDVGGNYISLGDFRKYHCTLMSSHGTIIIVIGVALILFVIFGSALFWYLKRVRNSDKYGGKRKDTKNGKLNLIVPDGRTYRETELHVIVERADLLTTDL